MFWKVEHGNLPSRVIFFLIASTVLSTIAFAVPLSNATSPAILTKRGSQTQNALFSWLQTTLQRQSKDIKYSWPKPDSSVTYLYGNKDHTVQDGNVTLIQHLDGGGQGKVYAADFHIKNPAETVENVVAKITEGLTGYNGAMIIDLISSRDATHMPKFYLDTIMNSNSATTQSLVVFEYLGNDAKVMWQGYARTPVDQRFDRLETINQTAKGLLTAHGLGIVHLDIKLANIMRKGSNQASDEDSDDDWDYKLKKRSDPDSEHPWVIIDWDYGFPIKFYEEKKQTYPKWRGTPGYNMSPEMWAAYLEDAGETVTGAVKWTDEEYIYLQDVFGTAMSLMQLLAEEEIFLEAWPELVHSPENTVADALKILEYWYQPDLEADGAKDFWNFLASAVCGPKNRISMNDFYQGLQKLKIPDFIKECDE